MIDHVSLNLTEAVEAAAKAVAKETHVDWDNASDVFKLEIREVVLPLVKAAAPFIVAQVLSDISSRTYDVE